MSGIDDLVVELIRAPAGAERRGARNRQIQVTTVKQVHTPAAHVGDPEPDGSHLLATVFGASGEAAASLWSISVLGGSPRKLMDNADARSVSPDGSQIAFVRGEPLNQEIWVMSADGERSAKVVGEQGDVFGAVAWSRDGGWCWSP